MSSYQQRIERGMAKYLAAHPGADMSEARKAARGHSHTGEHGVDRQVLPGNQVVISFRDERFAERAARMAEREEGRAKVVVTDKDGNTRELFANKGHAGGMSVDELAERIAEDGIDGLVDDALASNTNLGGSGADFDSANIREYQLVVL